MSSTRNAEPSTRRPFAKLAAAAALLAALGPAVAGCNFNYQRPVEPAMNPTEEDAAIAHRRGRWPAEPVDALYANSGVRAYANRFRYNYATQQNQTAYAGIFTGPAAFVGQTILFPFTFLRAPFGATETYRPLTVEPSYTGIPQRPPQDPVAPPPGAPVSEPEPPAQPLPPVPEVTPPPSSTPGTPTPTPGTPDEPAVPPTAPVTPAPPPETVPAVPAPATQPVELNK